MAGHNPGAGVENLIRMSVPCEDGDVEGWFLPAFTDRPGPAVIFAHGNAELIDHWPEFMHRYRELGVSVMLAEYRGYGRSAGDPSQAAITEDFVKFRDWVDARPEVDAGRVFYHGRSLGGGAVGQLAALRKPAALILESTFTSVADMAARLMVPANFISDPFDTAAVVATLRDTPMLIMHGTHDSVVPFEHGKRLAAAAHDVKFVSFAADHNDFPPDAKAYWEVIESFLSEKLDAPPS